MNREDHEDTGRFTLRDDGGYKDIKDTPDEPPAADSRTPPIDRLNSRITRVMLIVLCLMGVSLTVMYLDLRRRMDFTQNDGSAGIERLTETLGTIADKQTALETRMTAQTQALETATTGMQARLKTTVDDVQRTMSRKPDQAALEKQDKAIRQLETQLAILRNEMKTLNAVVTKFDDELSGQLQQIAGAIKKNQDTFAALEKKTQSISAGQVDKQALDLAIRLERMSVQEMMKEQARSLENKISALEKQVASLKNAPRPSATYSPPKPAAVPSSGMTGAVTEQPLN